MAERPKWTDARLDDLATRMDAGFDRVDRDLRELRGDIAALRQMLLQVSGGMLIGMISILATIVARG